MLQHLRVLRLARVARAAHLLHLVRAGSALLWLHRQMVGKSRLSVDERRSEPLTVGLRSLALAGGGLLLWSAGQLWMWNDLSGDRIAWLLEVIGPVLVAAAVVDHVRHLVARFGVMAVAAITVSVTGWAIAAAPFAADPGWYGTPAGAHYMSWLFGGTTSVGGVGLLLILVRKRLARTRPVNHAAGEIHASYFQLASAALGLFIWAAGQFALLHASSGPRWVQILATVGPLLVALAVITHVEQLSLRIGLLSVDLSCLAVLLWGASYLPLAIDPTLGQQLHWEGLCFWGIAGIGAAIGGAATLLVAVHVRTAQRQAGAPVLHAAGMAT